MSRRLLVLAVLAAAAPASAQDADKAKLGEQAKEVITKFCHECHKGPGSEGGETDFLNFKEVRDTTKTKRPLVLFGKAGESKLVARITKGVAGEKNGMPPDYHTGPRPTKADASALAAWANAGCPDPAGGDAAAAPVRNPVGTIEMLRAMKNYLEEVDQENRPYTRFFTLTHLHNDPRVTEADLQRYRAALAAAVNALSWQPRVVQPAPVDRDRTVFAVDIRDFGWDPVRGWDWAASYYPYGLSYQFLNGPLPGLQNNLQQQTGTQLPYLRADWFAATATRPPIYHGLLKFPDTLYPLEVKLGVDAAENFRRNRVARGAVTKSGVSQAHRLVERHDALYGAYWKSFDFKPLQVNPLSDLKRYPLGPLTFPGAPGYKNPFADRAGFKQDGGEMIFNLPNGLQAYVLVDGQERRIDKGPPDVVQDKTAVTGGPEVVNGISCMSCHSHGMKMFTDVVREETTVQNKELRKVELLFPLPLRMTGLLEEDQERFLRSMGKAVGGYLPGDGLKDANYTDPIAWAAKKYIDPVDLEAAGYELGTTGANLQGKLGAVGLKNLNVGAWAVPNGKVRREDWEAKGAFASTYQRVAAEARIGNPENVSP